MTGFDPGGHFRRKRREERPDGILRTVYVDLFVTSIGKSYELLGPVGKCI